MTTDAPSPERIRAYVRGVKERKVAEAELDGLDIDERAYATDVDGMVVFVRDGLEVATVWPGNPNRDAMLDVALFGVRAFNCDRLIVTLDMYLATPKRIRERGSPRPGQLQKEFRAGRHDLVSEGLAVMWVDRGEPGKHVVAQVIDPYVVDWEARTVRWTQEAPWHATVQLDASGARMGGVVPDTLRDAFDRRPILGGDDPLDALITKVGKELLGFDDRTLRLEVDLAAAGELIKAGHSVLLGTDDADVFQRMHAALDRPEFRVKLMRREDQ